MKSMTLKIFGIGTLGGALALAASIHSPASGPGLESEETALGHRAGRMQNHSSVPHGAAPRERSLKSRQTDHSMASHLRTREGSRIHVGGFVRSPGPVQWVEGMTLWKAIQTAGGATEFGSLRRVKVYRNGRFKQYDLTNQEFQTVVVEADDVLEISQKSWIGS